MTETNDIRIVWDNSDLFEGDFNFDTDVQDLEQSTGLQTAVLISLFTDRRARQDDVLPDPNNNDRRGWWGDLAAPDVDGDKIGSRLWLLEREKTTRNVLERAKQYAKEALQWMLDDGVAVRVDVDVERQGSPGNDVLAIRCKIYKVDGQKETFEYSYQWNTQLGRAQGAVSL